ncbi:MAG: hypothetical protein ACRYG7_34230 [Janthinobacterium lividum]
MIISLIIRCLGSEITRQPDTKKPLQLEAAIGKNEENESQNEKKTAAAAFQSFRRTACLAVPRIIHWWLIAFTVQNYNFRWGCHNLPVKNILCRLFQNRIQALKPINITRFIAFY